MTVGGIERGNLRRPKPLPQSERRRSPPSRSAALRRVSSRAAMASTLRRRDWRLFLSLRLILRCRDQQEWRSGASLSGLGPDRAPVNAVLFRQREHADAVRAGCSHSVHFAARESCSRSFLWFRRHANQSVVGLAYCVAGPLRPLIPCGNELLNPWSSVPAAPNCVHKSEPPACRGFSRLRGTTPVPMFHMKHQSV